MALIFSSGGGRLGNQLLNLIHLSAISYEYNINVYKISDLFITGKNRSFIFRINENQVNWEIVSSYSEKRKRKRYFLKIFIRLVHLYYFLSPNKISYKLGSKENLPKFLFGKSLKSGFSKIKFFKEARKKNIVLSGWGFRDWDLVLKHKESIIKNFKKGFSPLTNIKKKINEEYLFVHIRRSDFLEVNEFQELNFTDEIWLKSILKVCEIESIKKIILFSDSCIDNIILSLLKNNKIDISKIDPYSNYSFEELFIYYLYNAKSVICNASTLVLSISFIFHKNVYLPSKSNDFQHVSLDNAHDSYPTSLNWN